MKIKYLVLPSLIVLTAAAVALSGYRLKKQVIEPLDLERYMDMSVFELPFLARTDEELMFYVDNAQQLLAKPSDTTTSAAPSEPTKPTEPTTTPPATSAGETTPQPPQPTVTPVASGPTTEFPDGVEDHWFDNTLFVGDSRMDGLELYCPMSGADYFCEPALTIGSVMTKTLDGKTFQQVLSGKTYDKIIVNFGLNEAGNSELWFKTSTEKFIQTVRAAQPNAKIIFNAIMPVTKGYVTSSKYGSSFEPDVLQKRSQIFASYANGLDIFYIDCTSYFADSDGYLYKELTGDGCHPTSKHYKTWFRWMRYALAQLEI